MSGSVLISVLARSLMSAKLDLDDLEGNATRTLGHKWKWIRPLANRYLQAFEGNARPRHRDVIRFLRDDEGFRSALAKYGNRICIAEWIGEPQRMLPVAAAEAWKLPRIETTAALADWLSLEIGELEWLADREGLGYKYANPKLRHYMYRVLPKPLGGVRLIEAPKRLLKEVQRRLLTDILDRIPPHEAAHGFVKERSVATFARSHVGRRILLRLDLQDFFPGFPAARVQGVFRTLGYPDVVADLLAGLCTNSVPGDIWDGVGGGGPDKVPYAVRTLYGKRHLPQGAPTSPALANVMAYRLDCRLTGLARTAGASYTRYADDLAFSGGEEFGRAVERFSLHAAAVALEEGFHVNHRKTRVMGRCQRQHLAGLVVNERLMVPRRDYERLEAILTNCVRLGPASQNRESHPDFRAHLEGRIGFVEMVNRGKAKKLRGLFKEIAW